MLGRRLDPVPGHIERRQKEQRQHRRKNDAADHGVGHRPPDHLAGDRDHAEAGGGGRQQDWPHPVLGRLDNGMPGIDACREELIDLADQDDGVANDDTGQCQYAEQGHKAERRAGRQQRGDDADQAQRGDADHQKELGEALQLDHQDQHDQQAHDRQRRHQGTL